MRLQKQLPFLGKLLLIYNHLILVSSKLCENYAGVSRGKGQDLFLQAFYQMLEIIKSQKINVLPLHAVIVGSDMNAQTKFELELRNFVSKKGIQDRVHFVNKTMNVTPYLAAIDVLVQNSQVPISIY
jgi:hypothetical protein